MRNFESFNSVINYIEDNLKNEINYEELANIMALSVYEFRRIFSFLAEISVYEYIKKRKLSCSVKELKSTDLSVCDIAMMYHYDSPSSYSRAFREFTGLTPTEARSGEKILKLYPKISVHAAVDTNEEISYKLCELSEFYITGYRGISNESDTVCCEKVWENFDEEAVLKAVKSADFIIASYENSSDGNVICTIGAKSDSFFQNEKFCCTKIPQSLWMIFFTSETDNIKINEIYEKLYTSWLPASGYKRNAEIPNIEIFPVSEEEWQICIPVTAERSLI